MHHTFMLSLKTETGETEILGPCTRQELYKLMENNEVPEDVDCLDEFLFKVLHPIRYQEAFESNKANFIYAALANFYKGERTLSSSLGGIMSETFVLNLVGNKILLKFSMLATSIEASKLTQHLLEYIENTDTVLEICNSTYADFQEN